jgi:CheY-like chemotaxis protein
MTVTNGRPKVFSTFEVGKICGVFHTTVINWVNKGKLKAALTPGGHRRIALTDLVDFMRRFEMPIPPDLETRDRKVLVVEDDLSMQRLFVRALQGLDGVTVEACSGGLEALIAVGKDAPDLLVLDIRIPQVDGFEVCRVLRASEQTRPIRIIAVSGEDFSPEEEAQLRGSADAFFRKPLSMAEFKRRASELLDVEGLAAGK